MKIKHFVSVDGGVIKYHDPTQWSNQLRAFDGRKCFITLSEEKKKRTIPENNYYHGVVVKILSDFMGYSHDEMHGVLKFHFKIDSTTLLNTKEFEELMQKIREWAWIEYQIMIPLPNEVDL
jgi:hypothetical protein